MPAISGEIGSFFLQSKQKLPVNDPKLHEQYNQSEMSANREKTSSVMGITVSVLLHGIFFAGCLALDASSVSASDQMVKQSVEINKMADKTAVESVKS